MEFPFHIGYDWTSDLSPSCKTDSNHSAAILQSRPRSAIKNQPAVSLPM